MTTDNHNELYEFHGLELKGTGSQFKTTCPFCDKQKLYISKKTGQYECKACAKTGNKFTFLTAYHKVMVREGGSSKELKKIKRLRDDVFSELTLKEFGLCINHNGEVMIPISKPGAKNLVNLRKWSPETKKAYNTPGCCSLFFAKWEKKGPIYVCEGEWDAIALLTLLRRAKWSNLENVSIVAVPGANIFKESWLSHFKDRKTVLIYDADKNKKRKDGTTFNPAKDGMAAAVAKLSKVTDSIKTINWTKVAKKLPDGYDIRDHLKEAIKTKKSKTATRKLLLSCDVVEVKKESASTERKAIKPLLEVDTFEKVVANFREAYSINQSFIDVLATCFASIVSLKIPGNPIWTFIVAPPSSGKTSIIESFESCYDFTEHVSKMTSTSMVSGWASGKSFDDDGNENSNGDSSILSRMKNKVLFVKDFTTVLTMGNEKDKLFGLLRDAYDGSFVQHYGNGISREYHDLYFGIVAGVTQEIHAENRTSLGERFLKVNLIDDKFEEDDHILTALKNLGQKNEHKEFLQATVNGFMYHLKDKDIPSFPEKMHKKLIALSKIVAMVRTCVSRNGTEINYRPESEVGTRIATQLVKLGCAIAMVYGKKEVDEDCYRLMQKVAFDTCVGWQLEVVQHLERLGDCTIATLAQKMNIHPNSVRKIIADSLEIGIISLTRVSNGSGRRGNKSFCYRLSKKMKLELIKAGITFKKKKLRKTTSKRTKKR